MENEFKNNLNDWLKEVAEGCHNLTTDPQMKMDLDFYACQSNIFYQPEILIIGINPGGGMSYSKKNNLENRNQREPKDLYYDSNQFISNYNAPDWSKLKPLCDLFSGEILRPVFINSVITNLIYFNSGTFAAFKKQPGFKKGLEFCMEMNFKLIEIIQPKNILLMGKPVLDNLTKTLDEPVISELIAENGKSDLVRKSHYKRIPVYWIQHPSAFGGEKVFNYGRHQEAKKLYFETIFGTEKYIPN